METRDALLQVMGAGEATRTLEAAGWRRIPGGWLPPAEEPKPLTWDALCLQGTLYFPWGRESTRDYVPALRWSISDPLSGSWKCRGVHTNSYGDLYYHFQYVPAAVPSESVYRGEGPTGRVLDNGKIRFTDPEFPGITWSDPDPLKSNDFLKADWVREKIDKVIVQSSNLMESRRLHDLKEALGL